MANHTALITGASRGIGRELTFLLARDGYDVVLVARRKDDLDALASVVEEECGVRTTDIAQDLARPEAAKELYDHLREREIRVDVLVNNAGTGAHGRFAAMDPSTTFEMLQLNIVSLTQLTRYLLEDMEARAHGKVLNVASTAAFQPGPLMAVYYASKGYVLSFSEALVEECRDTAITITTLAPGPTSTQFQERSGLSGTLIGPGSPFMMDAESVARAGYRGLLREKSLVVPGLMNKLHYHLLRLVPRGIVRRIVRSVQEKR
jgi:short-subunit dehydrogenase